MIQMRQERWEEIMLGVGTNVDELLIGKTDSYESVKGVVICTRCVKRRNNLRGSGG
jgi:hypothetical protein